MAELTDTEINSIVEKVKTEVEASMKAMMDDAVERIRLTIIAASPSTPVVVESGAPANPTPDLGKKHDEPFYDPGEEFHVEATHPVKAQETLLPNATRVSTQGPPEEPFSKQQQLWMEKRFFSEMRGSQGPRHFDIGALNVIPELHLPENFKTPNFILYDGSGDPQDHLRMYCRKMAPYSYDEPMMIYLFQESLSGPASKWFSSLDSEVIRTWQGLAEAFVDHYAFNEQLAATKEDLAQMKKKSTENVRQYAQRWRGTAADVRPPLTEKEMVSEFRKTLGPEYQMPLAACVKCTFMELVDAAVNVEEASKGEKASGGFQDKRNFKKKEGSVNALSGPSGQQNHYQPRNNNYNPRPQSYIPGYTPTPPTVYQSNFRPQALQQEEPIQIDTQYHRVPPPAALQRETAPQRAPRPPRVFDPIPLTYASLLQQLLNKGKISLAPALRSPRTDSPFYNPNQTCVYHTGQVGHDVENCYPLKCKVQDMIEAGKLKFGQPNISRNPLPNHGGPTINAIFSSFEVNGVFSDEEPIYIEVDEEPIFIEIPEGTNEELTTAALTRSGRILSPGVGSNDTGISKFVKGTEKVSVSTAKKPASEEDLKEFDSLVKPVDYDVVEQLKKAPAKISMFALLQSSEKYKKALLEVLQDAHVPTDLEEGAFKDMVGAILAPCLITYSDDDLTEDGSDHVSALHISLQIGDSNIPKVLVDNGSSINVVPKYILDMLNVDHSKTKKQRTFVRAFDGTSREVEGMITLPVTVGPATFETEFHILDINPSFNLLLGRPWIHKTGAIPSTLHQMIRFMYEGSVVTVKGDHVTSWAAKGKMVPCIGTDAADGASDFQSLECANASIRQELSESDEESDWGLIVIDIPDEHDNSPDSYGQWTRGHINPMEPTYYDLRFGLGYHPTEEELRVRVQERRIRNPGAELHLAFPPLSETFMQLGEYSGNPPNGPLEEEDEDEDYGIAALYAELGAECEKGMGNLFICAISDENGPASLPHPSGGKSLENWTLRGRPERLHKE